MLHFNYLLHNALVQFWTITNVFKKKKGKEKFFFYLPYQIV